jgi:tetratricopeptide (TPR) repeat protein
MTATAELARLTVLRTAVAACASGRLAEGEQLLRLFLRDEPASVDGWFNLGKALRDMGRLEESAHAYRISSALQPDDPMIRYNFGNVLRDLNRPAEAAAQYREAIQLNPHLQGAHNNLGLVLEEAGDRKMAIACYERAIAVTPDFGPAYANLGLALLKEGRLIEAEQNCRRAIAMMPGSAVPHYNLAGVLLERDQYLEADQELAEAIHLNNAFPEAWVNRAIGYLLTERLDEAIAACRQAILLKPAFAEAHLNLAVALLQAGAFEEGWKEYEWRFLTSDGKNPRRFPHIGEWDGRPLTGKTLLVYQEQGIGDILQCLRFVPLLAQEDVRIIVACQRTLHPLLKLVRGVCGVLSPGERVSGVDYVCPVFSLPRLLGVTSESIPGSIPYLQVEPHQRDRWESITGLKEGVCKVGIAWTGNAAHNNNRRRSLPCQQLDDLLNIPGVELHSLHTGMKDTSPEKLHCHDDDLNNFAEVAALIQAVDLVLTVDTSFAHLAGGLGVPVWLMLNHGGDWRWMLHREDSPWYPTMRIFRQRTPGDWAGVVAEVRTALDLRLAGGAG